MLWLLALLLLLVVLFGGLGLFVAKAFSSCPRDVADRPPDGRFRLLTSRRQSHSGHDIV
jgi:hypothetical protein